MPDVQVATEETQDLIVQTCASSSPFAPQSEPPAFDENRH
jgi:hypothetical protein